MKGVYISFDQQIRAHGRAGGRDLSPDEIVWLDQSLNLILDLDPVTMKLGFALGAGRFGDLQQALDVLRPQPQRMAA